MPSSSKEDPQIQALQRRAATERRQHGAHAVVAYLVGWFLRLSLTGERYLL